MEVQRPGKSCTATTISIKIVIPSIASSLLALPFPFPLMQPVGKEHFVLRSVRSEHQHQMLSQLTNTFIYSTWTLADTVAELLLRNADGGTHGTRHFPGNAGHSAKPTTFRMEMANFYGVLINCVLNNPGRGTGALSVLTSSFQKIGYDVR